MFSPPGNMTEGFPAVCDQQCPTECSYLEVSLHANVMTVDANVECHRSPEVERAAWENVKTPGDQIYWR